LTETFFILQGAFETAYGGAVTLDEREFGSAVRFGMDGKRPVFATRMETIKNVNSESPIPVLYSQLLMFSDGNSECIVGL
jgi:hypothetical protein